MKTGFTREYLLEHPGCYSKDDINNLPFPFNEDGIFTVHKAIKMLPLSDYVWYLSNHAELTTRDTDIIVKQLLLAIMPLLEDKYQSNEQKDLIQACIDDVSKLVHTNPKLKFLYRIKSKWLTRKLHNYNKGTNYVVAKTSTCLIALLALIFDKQVNLQNLYHAVGDLSSMVSQKELRIIINRILIEHVIVQ